MAWDSLIWGLDEGDVIIVDNDKRRPSDAIIWVNDGEIEVTPMSISMSMSMSKPMI